jgi:hypothetical protein
MVEVNKSNADFAFFLYDLDYDDGTEEFHLKKQRVVYTQFADVLKQIAKFEAGPIEEFTEILQKKLDKKRKGEPETVEPGDLVVE